MTEYRARKQAEKIVADLEALLQVFVVSCSALETFQRYNPAKDVAVAIADNATLVRVYLDKYRKVLESKPRVD